MNRGRRGARKRIAAIVAEVEFASRSINSWLIVLHQEYTAVTFMCTSPKSAKRTDMIARICKDS